MDMKGGTVRYCSIKANLPSDAAVLANDPNVPLFGGDYGGDVYVTKGDGQRKSISEEGKEAEEENCGVHCGGDEGKYADQLWYL
jgi:hypothetical protein